MSDEAQTIAMAFLGECRCGKGQCQTCLLAGEIRRRDTQLAAVTAERDEARLDVKDWSDRAYAAEHNLTVATERAEKAEAQFKSVQPFLVAYHSYVMQHHPPGWAVDPGNVVLTINNIIESKVKDANARAVAYWAECEAWRAVASKMRREGKWINEPIETREASDRARNPILEPPTQGGENP